MDPFGGNEKQEPKLEEVSKMLEDFDHFANTFLPPVPFDPTNNNEYVDLSEIFGPDMAKEAENTAERPAPFIGDQNIQGVRVRYFTTRTNAGTQFGRRSRRVSKKETCSRAERLIKGRIASRQWYEKKKAQSLQTEAEMKRLREENAVLKNKAQSLQMEAEIQFLQMEAEIQRLREENAALKKLQLPQPGRQLQRTFSASI